MIVAIIIIVLSQMPGFTVSLVYLKSSFAGLPFLLLKTLYSSRDYTKYIK